MPPQASKEPHWIWRGVVLAFIGTVAFISREWIKDALTSIWEWVAATASWCWGVAWLNIPTPLAALVLLAIPLLIWLFRLIPRETAVEPKLGEYTIDAVEGVVWRWEGGGELVSYCPICDMDLKWFDVREDAFSRCQNCDASFLKSGLLDSLFSFAEREINRRIRTGEWKDAAKRMDDAKNQAIKRREALKREEAQG